MIELTIHGRGGQGGVTLAKLIAQAYFLRGQHSQAFGVYAAERSGAPLQAYVRIDDQEIVNHNQVKNPDHMIVLDRTLIGPSLANALAPEGWMILNSSESPGHFEQLWPGRRVATVDATRIAVSNGLGTRTVPIVNTTMLGAVARVLGLAMDDVSSALSAMRLGGANEVAANAAFEHVVAEHLSGECAVPTQAIAPLPATGLFDKSVGCSPSIRTGSWATRQPHRRHLTPPCNHACPAGNDVQSFLAAAAEKDFDKALAILHETSPFPGICGRVCPAPCMESCNRNQLDASVNVRDLERFCADHANHELRGGREDNGMNVAVVGSGPAGLSAAYQLVRLGYAVTVYETQSELGGVMRTGIPTYRLPRDVLDKEIGFILDLGVQAKTSQTIDREKLLELTQWYSAVFVATGMQEARSLNLAPTRGGSTNRVMQGIDFLDRVRNEEMSVRNEDVIVIGGGNTAIDASRSARRLGAKSVRIVYRRTRTEMPAISEEIEAAIEEGIHIDELVSPLRLQTSGDAASLTCQRMELGEPDETGRARPVPVESDDAFFGLKCDRIILALGQSPDLSILPEGTELEEKGKVLGLTNVPVFCGGDFASNDGTVSAAIGSGRVAALHIHRTLTDEDLFPPPEDPVAKPSDITTYLFAHEPQREGEAIPPSIRRNTFEEVHTGFESGQGVQTAAIEAGRCFSCGVCNECDQCVTYCPEGILVHDESGYRFDYDYCKGCGVCATACPRGVVYMAEL